MKPWVRRLVRSGAVITVLLLLGPRTASCVVRQVAAHEAERDCVKPELHGLSPEVSEAFRRTLLEPHAELTDLSTRSTHRVVEGAGHYIHVDRTSAVLEAIREVVTSVRERGASG